MTEIRLSDKDFERETNRSEAARHQANIEANDAFIAAMARAALKGKVKVNPGVYKDTSPRLMRVIRGDAPLSACGSPAALCTELGALGNGAQTLR